MSFYNYSLSSSGNLSATSTATSTATSSGGGYSLLGGTSSASSSSSMASAMGTAMPIIAGIGAIQSAMGAFFASESAKENLKFQSDMAAINARMAENTAQSIMYAGEKEVVGQTLRAGKVLGSQKAAQGARGVVMGEGSAAEEIATTNLMKDIDKYTINANTVRAAWAARTQAANYQNESLIKGTMGNSINSTTAATTSLINGATSVASAWYMGKKFGGLNLSSMFGGE